MLMRIRHLIIGGGSISADLEQQLRSFPNAVWSTYGMTETLSHIALRRISGPEADAWYTPLSDVQISISHDEDNGYTQRGCLTIFAPQVCSTPLRTNDIAELHADGRRFRIIGRRDNVICSGGIKNKKVKHLSGGEKQRVAIARAIVKKPEIILADEPTGNLNFAIGEAVIKQLIEVSKGKTLIAVTHDERLGKYFDHIIDMNQVTGGRRDV